VPKLGRKLALLLLAAAAVLGLVRSVLDSYFTTRVVELPSPPPASWPATASRVVLVVLDGLRPMEAFNPDSMPALAGRRPQAAWGIARAGEITMTAPGVRMLGSGASSDFMDILHNWHPRTSAVTSLFAMAKQKGLRSYLYGDHVWKEIFTSDFAHDVDVRLDAWGYYRDVVHAPDMAHLADLRELVASKEPFDLLVVHLVGPDHASHQFRVISKEFAAYLRWLDPKVDELLSSLLGIGATILVTSDHGMSDSGQHGGEEPTARKTPYLFQGPGIKIGPGPLLGQADLPATLAALLGVPLPPFGEGRVAREVLAAPPESILAMMRANVAQAHDYLSRYQAKYGKVPRALVDGAPDLATIASQHGMASALAAADRYLEAYHSERRSVDKSVGRTWAWLLTIVAVALLVLLPAAPSTLPRGTLTLSGLAFLASAASWVTTAALWPSVVLVLGAALWQGCALLAEHRPSLVGGATMVLNGLLVIGLFLLAHVVFKRQFRSATMVRDVPDVYFRAAGYVFVLPTGILAMRWRPRTDPSSWVRHAWMVVAFIFPFLVTLPSGKLLLLLSPALGLGFLWMLRLARISAERPQWRLVELLESEWFLFVVSLAWVCLASWSGAMAPFIDQQRGVLGWTLNRAPWLLGLGLGYHLILTWKTGTRLAKALSIASVLTVLPPLVLAHHIEQFNLLVWLALLAMVFAAANRRSSFAVVQLGAATYALASLFGSASYALTCLVICGTYWAFVLVPNGAGQASHPSDAVGESKIIPVLGGLGICFVWLTVQQLREGSFSFSDLEVAVGFYGNPIHDIGRGAAQVSARFILPMVLLLIPLRRTAASPRIFGVLVALFLLHIAFLLVGFLATQSQFYTPYRLAGELVHFIALIAAVPLLFLVVGLPDRDVRTAGC
jgi:hypothetical protein